MSLPECMYAYQVYSQSKGRPEKDTRPLGTRVITRVMYHHVWMLLFMPESSGRASSTLNGWDISLVHVFPSVLKFYDNICLVSPLFMLFWSMAQPGNVYGKISWNCFDDLLSSIAFQCFIFVWSSTVAPFGIVLSFFSLIFTYIWGFFLFIY